MCLHHPSAALLASPPGGLTVAGWGRTERAASSPSLRYTTLAAVAPAACQREYTAAAGRGELGPGIPELQLLDSQVGARSCFIHHLLCNAKKTVP